MAIKRAGLSAGAPMCTYAGRLIDGWRDQGLTYDAIGTKLGISKEHTINIHQHGRGVGNSVVDGIANELHGKSVDAANKEADAWYAKFGPWRGTKASSVAEQTVDLERQSPNLALELASYEWPRDLTKQERATVTWQAEKYASSLGQDLSRDIWRRYLNSLVESILVMQLRVSVGMAPASSVPTGGHPDSGPSAEFLAGKKPPTKPKRRP
jgi:hypothetical protein